MTEQTRCPACHYAGISVFIEIAGVPVHCNLLWTSRKAAVEVTRGDIRLGFCHACGMVYNLSFDPDLMEYTQRYENSLEFSPKFQEYARKLAARLIRRYELRGKDVIEIGCGKGHFLSLLCQLGQNRGVGFDPSYEGRTEREADGGRATFIRDFYSEAYAGYAANFICCRHTLEHIHRPRPFLSEIRRAIGNGTGTVVFFEVPNAFFTLRGLGIWDVIYEHCSYFSAPSLTRIFEETGFTVLQVYQAFGGQFLCLEASPNVAPCRAGRGSAEELGQLSKLVSAFGEKYRNKVETWNRDLSRLFEKGRRIVLWGAGAKGVTFLNTQKAGHQIEYVVDINPRKQGMYVAGTGQQIVPPEFLSNYRPDVVIVMNPIYCDEIQRDLNDMGVSADLIAV